MELQQENKMGVMPVNKLLLSMSLPIMISMLVQALYNIVDSIFVAKISENALTAVSLAFPIQSLMIATATGTGVGVNAILSKSLGEKNFEKANKTAANGVFLAVLSYLLFVVVGIAATVPFYQSQTGDEEILGYGIQYLTIVCVASIGIFAQIIFERLLQSTGKTIYTMITQGTGAVINIILDPILIFGCSMGIAGAAWGTVIAQCCTCVYVICFLRSRIIPVRLCPSRLQKKIVLRILSIGCMSFMITILDNLIIIFLNTSLRKYGGDSQGDILITCATVIQSFMTIVACPAQGITTGCGTIFSFHYGAGNYTKIRQAFLYVFLLCGVYIGTLGIAVQVLPEVFAGFFLKESGTIQLTAGSIRMYTFALLGIAVQYALVDGLTAMGKVKYALPLSLFRKIVYMICLCILPLFLDIRYVFYAGTISDAVGALFSLILFWGAINPRIRRELSKERMVRHG